MPNLSEMPHPRLLAFLCPSNIDVGEGARFLLLNLQYPDAIAGSLVHIQLTTAEF